MRIRNLLAFLIAGLIFVMVLQSEIRAATYLDNLRTPAPTFSISTADTIRTSIQGIRPVRITAGSTTVTMEPAPLTVLGTRAPSSMTVIGTVAPNPYKTSQGVVVSILNPLHQITQSALDGVLHGSYGAFFRAGIDANDPQTNMSCEWLPGEIKSLAWVGFKGLPSGRHTYCLSIGITLPQKNLQILKQENMTESLILDGSQLVSNPATSEIRGLFTYDQSALTVELVIKPEGTYNYFYRLHHVQLTCLD
jgi:hypothetical protein